MTSRMTISLDHGILDRFPLRLNDACAQENAR
jgi:hypothetical protein